MYPPLLNPINFHTNPYVPVRCTFVLSENHLSTNILVLCTFFVYSLQQGCKIFVEKHLKNLAIGAEHRFIKINSESDLIQVFTYYF
jgi:hypothetical protein